VTTQKHHVLTSSSSDSCSIEAVVEVIVAIDARFFRAFTEPSPNVEGVSQIE
jgi:hypothetical protein